MKQSKIGNEMNRTEKHRLNPLWRRIARGFTLGTIGAAGFSILSAADVTLLDGSFETDGSIATGDGRYTVQGGGDDGSQDYFGRRELGSAGTRVRGTIDGSFMWSIRDIDQVGEEPPLDDLEPDEGRV